MAKDDNFTGVIPYINVEDATAAIEFYKRAFGAEELARMPAADGKRVMHCHLSINGGGLMVADAFTEFGPFVPSQSYTMQLVVEDGQTWWDRAVGAGCEVVLPFEVAPWGDRYGQVRDPHQITWAILTPANPV